MIFFSFLFNIWDANEKQTNNANNASICIRYTFDGCFHFSTAMRPVSRMKQYTQVCTLEIPSRFLSVV